MTEALIPYEYTPITQRTPAEIRVYKRQLKCLDASEDEWKMLEMMSTAYKTEWKAGSKTELVLKHPEQYPELTEATE